MKKGSTAPILKFAIVLMSLIILVEIINGDYEYVPHSLFFLTILLVLLKMSRKKPGTKEKVEEVKKEWGI